MAEYIEREVAIKELIRDAPEQVGYSREDAADCIRYMDAADVEPVRHERWECREKWDIDVPNHNSTLEYCGWYCSH